MQEIIASETQLDEVAEAILKAYPQERVFGFYGEMGAGKTTLIKEMCKCLGVQDITSSPTFAIVNEYWTEGGQPLYHFDFYRIDEPADATRIGFEEYLYSDNYCFIEWTEKVEEILQGDFIPITIQRVDDVTRKFIF
ncbi:MAG: tRNA (adenosine(37)-N6)-threonylcarbamoyltransferase complex ATPase subunit type 1 TsaE [Bacteroidales bacterium]|nr:tRNA (adenosine(37)-N6)-threonylcarbamoyltransferase complex ATPase subunit type 1 TsaE [Bacteroidales bacterium]